MTMKKVLVFLLVMALAVGGIGFAHAAVTASQDDLVVYPTLEWGDMTALNGHTAGITFTCGDHLIWKTDYPFGGEAKTEFIYHRKPIQPPSTYRYSTMDVWLNGGMSSSVSGGFFSPRASEYGNLLDAVAKETPAGGSRTMTLRMADYVSHYLPDYQLRYEDDTRFCTEDADLYALLIQEDSHTGSFIPLMQAFRFPVQENHIISVTVQKDDADRMIGIELYPENGPELHFLSDISDQGVWFVPVFRDENGAPLPYDSPRGHGIYFIPWRHDDLYLWTEGRPEPVTLDVKKARLCYPLDENLRIEHMVIDAEAGTAQMLTLEDGQYFLTTCDLESGRETARLAISPFDPDDGVTSASFHREGEHLLLTIQSRIALTDAAGETLLLTAPDALAQNFNSRSYDPDTGDLRFDGETLILADTAWFREGSLWAAAWRQDELVCYGEYDCSITRGNDNWYYSYVTAEEYPLVLK